MPPTLRRELGVWGAIVMGLGSIVGTGVFVSIGIATRIAGVAVIGSIALAAIVALCNGLSAAQLAANHPVSGGTYEYGYRYLNPAAGFVAGWLFLLAKSASAATAALGFAGYLLSLFGISDRVWTVAVALMAIAVLTLIGLGGIQKSHRANTAIVSVTLLSLLFFIAAGLPQINPANFTPFFAESNAANGLFHAAALMFVSYTGYGRIATMGEEVHNPEKTIPKAMLITLAIAMMLYIAVAGVGIGVSGVSTLATVALSGSAPLEVVARSFAVRGSSVILTIGAVTAMLGVLLNLILGLSRVLLAMGRRGDMPAAVAQLNRTRTAPAIAIIAVSIVIAGLALIGNVKTTWSFSAFTVLVYYALTNLCALRLSSTERLYPQWIAWLGFIACLFLAFWIDVQIWIAGLAIIAFAYIWRCWWTRR